jgi:hypothetical protein
MEDAMISTVKDNGVVGVSVLSCIALFLLSACGTVEHKVNLLNNFTPDSATGIEVGKVVNETGKTFDPEVNVEDMLRRALTGKLSAEGLSWSNATPKKLVLDSKILDYDQGDAFKRWLLPGWGSTVLTIQSDLRQEGQVVGTVDAKRTVSVGGAYTIGAWKTVFDNLAGDVVEDLRSKIPKVEPKQ